MPRRSEAAQRVGSIDALRGAVMVIMALDHVRDFIHRSAMGSSPTDLASTTPVLFFTRWITHFCAPIFMLTAGLSAFLWWQRGRTRKELSWFLLTRGLWLVVLELTVMQLAYNFDVSRSYPVFLLVLWVLGLCMIWLAALVWLPLPLVMALSIGTIALHDLLDGIKASQLGAFGWLWHLAHEVGAFRLGNTVAIVGYPVVPWVAVMALGFSVGPTMLLEAPRRRRQLATLGIVMTLAFFVIRSVNMYGDPAPWAAQASPMFTVLSFLNTTKYPPSLAFLLMTIGPGLLALAWLDHLAPQRSNPLVVFGRVPLCYFIVHFYVAHGIAVVLALIRYGSPAWAFVFHPVPSMGGPASLFPPGFGYDLTTAYAVWAVVVIGLYPACRWFGSVKARRTDWWLRYL